MCFSQIISGIGVSVFVSHLYMGFIYVVVYHVYNRLGLVQILYKKHVNPTQPKPCAFAGNRFSQNRTELTHEQPYSSL